MIVEDVVPGKIISKLRVYTIRSSVFENIDIFEIGL